MRQVASSINTFPVTGFGIAILPTSPRWGDGGSGNLTAFSLEIFVQEAKNSVKLELSKDEHNLIIREVFGFYSETSMYSTERKLICEMILFTSRRQAPDHSYVALFQKSALWKRACVGPLEAFPRSSFMDWSRPLDAPGMAAKADASLERRQWHTGPEFWKGILKAAFEKMDVKTKEAHIRNWVSYDDTLQTAVMEINGSNVRTSPRMSYAGTTFNNFIKPSGGKVVKSNIHLAAMDSLVSLVKSRKYGLPGYELPDREPVPNEAARPVAPVDFKVCIPVDDLLPFRQSTIDEYANAADAEVRASFNAVLVEHDKKFNPSGVPWKARGGRAAPTPLESIAAAHATRLPPRPNAPTLEALVGKVEVAGGVPQHYSLIADEKGRFYVLGKADEIISNTEPLLLIKGNYKTGHVATKVMDDTLNWLEYNVNIDTLVAAQKGIPADMQEKVSGRPQAMGGLLMELERAGIVHPKLRNHVVTRVDGPPRKYTIASEGPACLVASERGELRQGTRPSRQNLSHFLDIPMLKSSPHLRLVQMLTIDPGNGRLTGEFPGVYFKDPVRIHKDELLQISWEAAAGAAAAGA